MKHSETFLKACADWFAPIEPASPIELSEETKAFIQLTIQNAVKITREGRWFEFMN